MITQLYLLCFGALSAQQNEPAINVVQDGFVLTAESIVSEDIDGGLRYELQNFDFSGDSLSLKASLAVIDVLNSGAPLPENSGWAAELFKSLGLDSEKFSLTSVEISGNVVFQDSRFTVTADTLGFRPFDSVSEFTNMRAEFAAGAIGPNGWPVLITAEKMLELPGGILEFHDCNFSTCFNEPQHYSTSFGLLRATKLDNNKTLWQPSNAWLNFYGWPIIPLPSPDFIDGEDFFGLKGINFGSSRITGNAITPQFGGRTVWGDQKFIDWGLSPGYSDLRGFPIVGQIKYSQPDFLSDLNVFYLRDQSSDFHRLSNVIRRDNSQRYLVDWHNHWRLAPQWSLNVDLALTSDHLVAPEFYRQKWANDDDAESAVELFMRGDDNYFLGTFSAPALGAGFTPLEGFPDAPGPQGQYLSYQPYFEYNSYLTSGDSSLPSWLSTSWGGNAGRLLLRDHQLLSANNTDYLTNLDAAQTRVSGWGNIEAALNLGGVSFSPGLTLRGGAWRDTMPATINDDQLYLESYLTSSAIFIQNYDDGWKHKVVPSLTLRSQTELLEPGATPVNFDGNNSLQQGRLIELGLRQFFYAPKAEHPWLDFQLLQPYYLTSSTQLGSSLMPFRQSSIASGLGPSELRIQWVPSTFGSALKGISTTLNMRYDFELDRADEIVAQINMSPQSNYFYGLNYLEANGTKQDFALGSVYAGLRVSKEWAASMRKSRNFSGDAGFFSAWEVTHYTHDFSIDVGYTLVESTGADGFYFSISPRFAHDTFNSTDYSLRNLR